MTDDEVANAAFEISAEGGDEGRALFLVLYIMGESINDTYYLDNDVLPTMPQDDQVRIKFWLQEHKRAAQLDMRECVERRMKQTTR